jgi:hypothetical protein
MRAQMGTPRKALLKDAEEAVDLALLPRQLIVLSSACTATLDLQELPYLVDVTT